MQKFKMAAKCGGKMILGQVASKVCIYPGLKNIFEIALAHSRWPPKVARIQFLQKVLNRLQIPCGSKSLYLTVSEINVDQQKSKMAAKCGGKNDFGKNFSEDSADTLGTKVSPKSL